MCVEYFIQYTKAYVMKWKYIAKQCELCPKYLMDDIYNFVALNSQMISTSNTSVHSVQTKLHKNSSTVSLAM